MHHWGDDWFEKSGNDLYAAIDYCCENFIKYGRIGCHGKEKYGTFRDQTYFYKADWAIHELVKPGYVYYQWSKKFMLFEIHYLGPIIRFLKIDYLIRLYQAQVYNFVIQQACKKWPNVIDEICHSLDHEHLVKPGIFGKICGKTIHDKYWRRI